MRSKIGLVLFLMGCAGVDGSQAFASAIMFLIGLFILWTESKKIDVPTAKQKRLKTTHNYAISVLILAQRKGICKVK